MSPSLLDSVLRGLPRANDPNVLVGFETNDDAGVYKLGPEMALVQTVDFFTPIVDDPHTFGQIAAANSLSDVYAMGGKPISALSIVGFPDKGEPEILKQILRGGLSKMAEAKCSVIGGHSIRNDDIQFGYAVTGLIHPQRVWRNVGAQTGDVLLLTKALGTGVLSTALKKDAAAPEDLQAAITSMSELNRAASEALQEFQEKARLPQPVHAVTDITGFGLLGHAREMALGNEAQKIEAVSLQIDHTAIRYLPGAEQAAREGFLPGGLKNNREFLGDCVGFAETVPQEFRDLLLDPQTSGGLLVAVAAEFGNDALAALDKHGVAARRIGVVIPKSKPLISVR
ncbi:MAG: selenide, water dikinase SelD [Acidobacteria bacterium]|nr:MAG: selenide, water dikinase SelD [Acidobacteriota bacterium]